MTNDEMRKKIEAEGWEFRGYENKIYKSLKPYLVHIVQGSVSDMWDVTGTFWGKTRKAATKAAYKWVTGKEKG